MKESVEQKEVIAKKYETPKAIEGTDGKVTMMKNGIGRRFHVSKLKEMEALGWEFIG